MSVKNFMTVLFVVAGFFAMSYAWGCLLETVAPQLVAAEPWGIVESIIAVAAIFASLIPRFVPRSYRYSLRAGIFMNSSYKWWLVAVVTIIFIGVIGVIIGASFIENQWLRNLNWGNYVNILLCSALALGYNIALLMIHNKNREEGK